MSSPDNSLPTKAVALKTFETPSQIFDARFTPCGTILLAACMDSCVRRWSLIEPPPKDAPPSKDAKDAALDPLAGVEPSKDVTPKKAPSKEAPKGKAPPPPPYDLRELPPIEGFQGWVQAFALHPKNPVAFAADTWGKLESWSTLDEKPQRHWSVPEAHNGWIRHIAVSQDGSQIATCAQDRFIRLWDAATGKKLAELQHTEPVFALTFHPDGKQLVFADLHSKIHILSVSPFQPVRSIETAEFFLLSRMQEVSGLRRLRFSEDGTTLFAAGAKPSSGGFVEATPMIVRIEFSSGKTLETLKIGAPKDGFVLDLDWHAKGFHAAAFSGQPGVGRLALIKPGAKEPFFADTNPSNCQSVTLHPGGELLVVVATNKNSGGNGKRIAKDGYPANNSPLVLYRLEA